MFGLQYVFSWNIFLRFQYKKNIFLNFDQFSKSEWDSRDGDGDSLCDRLDEFWSPPLKWGSLNIYRKHQRKLEQKSQC